MKTDLKNKKFIVVDLYSGRNSEKDTMHEIFNLSPNPYDGRYYGYCPRTDKINFGSLKIRTKDEKLDGILVIYVQKVKGGSNREIIGFCDNATVHREGIDNPSLCRTINNDKIVCTYSIESDYICDLGNLEEDKKFIIKITDYKPDMFRAQRFYKDKYPELDKKMIAYLENYLEEKELEDDAASQEKIQREDLTDGDRLENTSESKPEYTNSGSTFVKKNPRISKQALDSADYKCVADHTRSEDESRHIIDCRNRHRHEPLRDG